jgi:long-chain fatty acid transport protein
MLHSFLQCDANLPINAKGAQAANYHKMMSSGPDCALRRQFMRIRLQDLMHRPSLIALFLLAITVAQTRADGIQGNGVGARSMAMGGADVAWASDPLGAMAINPGALGFLSAPELDLGADAGLLNGHFSKPGVAGGDLDSSLRAFPDGAMAYPFAKLPVTVGLSVVPDSLLVADWHYTDPPGGLGGKTSYGYQQDKSEIVLLRSALGLAVRINSKLSLGLSAGLLYNENRLITPYIFQNLSPAGDAKYDGAKTLLNLHTTGLGWNLMAGILYQATTNWQFGASYTTAASIDTTGTANGDPYAQFGVPRGPLAFHYDAQVNNQFPQQASAGASWKFLPRWRAAAQVDWINWSDSFDGLPVILTHGSNHTVNSVLGANFSDGIPLNWSDEFVYRVGLEYDVTDRLALRAGYAYGQSPVPDSTLMPLTAAILEHTFTAGFGYRWRWLTVDVAYQYSLPATQNVGASQIRAGEYANSSTEVSAHLFALTAGIRF